MRAGFFTRTFLMSVFIVNRRGCLFQGFYRKRGFGKKDTACKSLSARKMGLLLPISKALVHSSVRSRESGMKESFAVCDFQCNLGVSSHTEEQYWLAVLNEGGSRSSLHLVSKGQVAAKERGWDKVRHRQSSLSVWKESQNCPSTKIHQTHTCEPDLVHIQSYFFFVSPPCSHFIVTPFPLFVSVSPSFTLL